MLYALVFVNRYLDLFDLKSWQGLGAVWNISFKFFYLGSSFYIVFIMMKVFPRTRERERAWKLGIWSVIGSLVLAPLAILIFEGRFPSGWFMEVRNALVALRLRLQIARISINGQLALLGFLHYP